MIKKYYEFIMESANESGIIKKLYMLNIPDLNFLINKLISADTWERPDIFEEILEVLRENKIDTKEIETEIKNIL
jgi:hypothetical protein